MFASQRPSPAHGRSGDSGQKTMQGGAVESPGLGNKRLRECGGGGVDVIDHEPIGQFLPDMRVEKRNRKLLPRKAGEELSDLVAGDFRTDRFGLHSHIKK